MGHSFSNALAMHTASLGQGVASSVAWACGCSGSCSDGHSFTDALEQGAATLGLLGMGGADVVPQVMLLLWSTVGVGEMASVPEPHSCVFDSEMALKIPLRKSVPQIQTIDSSTYLSRAGDRSLEGAACAVSPDQCSFGGEYLTQERWHLCAAWEGDSA